MQLIWLVLFQISIGSSVNGGEIDLLADLNPDFELGDTIWRRYAVSTGAASSVGIIGKPDYINAHAGDWYAYLGDKTPSDKHARGVLRQDFHLPAGTIRAKLTFYLNITSADASNPSGNDLGVYLLKKDGTDNPPQIGSFGYWSNENRDPNGNKKSYFLVQKEISLEGHGGDDVILQFYAETDDSPYTTFRLDDIHFVVTTQDERPNLAPYIPPTWSGQLIATKDAQSKSGIMEFKEGQDIFLNWAFWNDSKVGVQRRFSTRLFLDGNLITTSYVEGLTEGHYLVGGNDNILIGKLAKGEHEIIAFTDVFDDVLESNEQDNTISAKINIIGAPDVYTLEIGGAVDNLEIEIDGQKAPLQAQQQIRAGAKIQISRVPRFWDEFVQYWVLKLENIDAQKLYGTIVTFFINANTHIEPAVTIVRPAPQISFQSTSGEIKITDIPATQEQLDVIIQKSHDLTCWRDFDINPPSGATSFLPEGCSEKVCAAFFRTALGSPPDFPKTLLFPVPGYSALKVPVSSLLDHCNKDPIKTVKSTTPPSDSWYTGLVVGPYNADAMFVTYRGEILDETNSKFNEDDGLPHFILNAQGLSRPLELNLTDPKTIYYSGHPGYDFGVAPGDQNVSAVAADSGVIVPSFSGLDENRLFIEHDDGKLATAYLHLKKWSAKLLDHNETDLSKDLHYHAKAEHVERGEVLGLVGGAGQVLVFSSTSFTDLRAFSKRLLAQTDKLSQFLYSNFDVPLQTALHNFDQGGFDAEALKLLLAQNLNKLLVGPLAIYTSDRFAGMILRTVTQKLVDKFSKLQPGDIVRLNRLLLEDFYDKELSRDSATLLKQMFLKRFPQHLHFELYRVVKIRTENGTQEKHYLLMDPYGSWTENDKQVYPSLWTDKDSLTPKGDDSVTYKP